jgi:glutaredoxin
MPDALPEVVLYTRQGCHLCEVVKTSLVRLAGRVPFHLREIDIDTDPELVRQFNDDVPVVFLQGRKAFQHRLNEEEFLRLVSSRS